MHCMPNKTHNQRGVCGGRWCFFALQFQISERFFPAGRCVCVCVCVCVIVEHKQTDKQTNFRPIKQGSVCMCVCVRVCVVVWVIVEHKQTDKQTNKQISDPSNKAVCVLCVCVCVYVCVWVCGCGCGCVWLCGWWVGVNNGNHSYHPCCLM
jgi:hypothetical protein